MTKAIYDYYVECGRMGDISGIFIANVEDVEKLIENEVEIHFGEVLGKHSDISVDTEKSQFEELTRDPKEIALVQRILQIHGNTISGMNPFSYVEDCDYL